MTIYKMQHFIDTSMEKLNLGSQIWNAGAPVPHVSSTLDQEHRWVPFTLFSVTHRSFPYCFLFFFFFFLSAHVSSLISFCFFMTCSSLLILIIFQDFKMWTVSSRNFAKKMTGNAKCCSYVRSCNILTLWGRIPWVYSGVGSHIS